MRRNHSHHRCLTCILLAEPMHFAHTIFPRAPSRNPNLRFAVVTSFPFSTLSKQNTDTQKKGYTLNMPELLTKVTCSLHFVSGSARPFRASNGLSKAPFRARKPPRLAPWTVQPAGSGMAGSAESLDLSGFRHLACVCRVLRGVPGVA